MNTLNTTLAAIGQLGDDEIDLADAALQLARRKVDESDYLAARAHLSDLVRLASERAEGLALDDLPGHAAMISELLLVDFGYSGDVETYDDLDNANLVRVIERRQGLPVALGILWLHAAQAVGLVAHGVNFPGHFLVSLGTGSDQMLIDVFGGGMVMDKAGLEALLRAIYGRKVALQRDMLTPMGPRDVLLRLHGNIRSRQERGGAFGAALLTLADMQRIAPEAAPLWLDEARLHQEIGDVGGAFSALHHFLAMEPEGLIADQVRAALDDLRGRMN